MEQGIIVDLDRAPALEASRLSGAAMADSIILATAQWHRATLWTQDSDFDGLSDVKYYPKS
jgi:toxin FitB